jgi:hypothetical protein
VGRGIVWLGECEFSMHTKLYSFGLGLVGLIFTSICTARSRPCTAPARRDLSNLDHCTCEAPNRKNNAWKC